MSVQREKREGSFRAFIGVYRGSCSRLLEARQNLGEKSTRVRLTNWSISPYLDVLRSAECRRGSMVFPQVNTSGRGVRAYSRRTDQTNRQSLTKKETEDDKGGCFIYVFLLPTTEKRNTPIREKINFSNSGVWRKDPKKISPNMSPKWNSQRDIL